LVADLPGTDPQDIQTDLRDNLLTITATVKPLPERWKPVYEEYSIGHFMRQFRLGQQIDQSKITAQLRDGVLTLTLPKVDTARPRQIKIQNQLTAPHIVRESKPPDCSGKRQQSLNAAVGSAAVDGSDHRRLRPTAGD